MVRCKGIGVRDAQARFYLSLVRLKDAHHPDDVIRLTKKLMEV